MFCALMLLTMMHRVIDVNGKSFWRMMHIVMVYVMEDALLFVNQTIDMNCVGNVSS